MRLPGRVRTQATAERVAACLEAAERRLEIGGGVP